MVELTSHQGSVGHVLQMGGQILAEGKLSKEEEEEVREQMNLLNSRWEHLRVSSMERQSRYCAHTHTHTHHLKCYFYIYSWGRVVM